ncbi:hypothetical protein TL16_g09999 [Triparma laevis f. inornata]|uniref:Uncharacterized protein n=1 Tax=Triparma laevis f. inornata TaxID=1714386 RepID=A0A9W7BDL0_9STRA|nr:hypothetical protein TL16_g09999 [Triparma laevis f. inornata]
MFFETCMMRVDHLPLGMSAEGTNLDVCLTCTNCPEEGGECLHNFKRADSLMCDVCPGSETEILGNCQTCPSTFGEFLTFPPVTIALVLLLVVSMVLTISSYKPEGAEGIGVMRAGAEVGSNTGTTGAGVTTRVVVEGSSSVEGRAGRLGRAEKENVSVENNKEEKEDKEDSKREDEDKETMHPGGGGQRPQRRKKRWCSFWWWWWQCTNKGWTFLSNFKWDVTNTIRAKQLGASVQILQVFARLSPNMADWFLVVANRFSQLSLPVVEVQPVCSSWYEALSRSEWAFLKAWFLFLLLHAVIMGLCQTSILGRNLLLQTSFKRWDL